MGKRNKRKKHIKKKSGQEVNSRLATKEERKRKPLIFIAVVALMIGGLVLYNFVYEGAPNGSQGGAVDSYGRSPGHPHYGHNHS